MLAIIILSYDTFNFYYLKLELEIYEYLIIAI